MCIYTVLILGFPLIVRPLHAALDASDFDGIPNAVSLEEDIIGGGPPDEVALNAAKAKGIQSVIDLRAPEEGTEEEKRRVEYLGLKYFNIPTTAETLSHQQADELARILSNTANRPAILHCGSGNRVGAVWGLYLRHHRGMSSESALGEAIAKGMRSEALREKTKILLEID